MTDCVAFAARRRLAIDEALRDLYDERESCDATLLHAIDENDGKALSIDGARFQRISPTFGVSPSQRRKQRSSLGTFQQLHLAPKLRVTRPSRKAAA